MLNQYSRNNCKHYHSNLTQLINLMRTRSGSNPPTRRADENKTGTGLRSSQESLGSSHFYSGSRVFRYGSSSAFRRERHSDDFIRLRIHPRTHRRDRLLLRRHGLGEGHFHRTRSLPFGRDVCFRPRGTADHSLPRHNQGFDPRDPFAHSTRRLICLLPRHSSSIAIGKRSTSSGGSSNRAVKRQFAPTSRRSGHARGRTIFLPAILTNRLAFVAYA